MNKLMEEIKNAKKEIIKVEENSKRELTWDIAKGIGIISIVIRHITINKIAHDFVYMYHLAIFYFLSAYFYNENKYGDKPFEFFAQRLKTTWPKFVFFSIGLILCHNLFIKYHLYNPNVEIYSKFDHIISPILNSMTLQTSEVFAGALWFVPTLLVSLGLFGGMIYISRNASKKIGGSGYMFYIASFIGICFCISASRVIEKIPLLNKIIALLGKHSFSIMALHFACIKGVDAIYSRIIGETDPEVISKWVVTYPKELWIIYIIIGCGLPVIFSIVLDKIKKEREKI